MRKKGIFDFKESLDLAAKRGWIRACHDSVKYGSRVLCSQITILDSVASLLGSGFDTLRFLGQFFNILSQLCLFNRALSVWICTWILMSCFTTWILKGFTKQ